MTDIRASRACPDPATLAAFVEGTLNSRVQGQVERHVSGCPECPIVIAETWGFLHETAKENDRPARRWWWLAAAAAVTALCLSAVGWPFIDRDPLSKIKKISAAFPVRPIEGRLDDFEHAPFSRVRSGRSVQVDFALRAEVERLAEQKMTGADSLHAHGVGRLLTGDASRAADLLSAAAEADPNNVAIWNDLAAVHVALGMRGQTHLDAALSAARRAAALCPSCPAPLFNRALALEYLGRRAEADREYRRMIALEPASAWSIEAANRLANLRE